MRIVVMALSAFPLAGCDLFHQPPPAPTIVIKNATTVTPEECKSADPDWKDPPKGFEPLPDIARRERTNKDGFYSMRAKREVCRAGLKAADDPKTEFRG